MTLTESWKRFKTKSSSKAKKRLQRFGTLLKNLLKSQSPRRDEDQPVDVVPPILQDPITTQSHEIENAVNKYSIIRQSVDSIKKQIDDSKAVSKLHTTCFEEIKKRTNRMFLTINDHQVPRQGRQLNKPIRHSVEAIMQKLDDLKLQVGQLEEDLRMEREGLKEKEELIYHCDRITADCSPPRMPLSQPERIFDNATDILDVFEEPFDNDVQNRVFRQVSCEYCENLVANDHLHNHISLCDMFPVECDKGCNSIERFTRQDLKSVHHNLSHPECCPKLEDKCSYCACPEVFNKRTIVDHSKICNSWPHQCPFKDAINCLINEHGRQDFTETADEDHVKLLCARVVCLQNFLDKNIYDTTRLNRMSEKSWLIKCINRFSTLFEFTWVIKQYKRRRIEAVEKRPECINSDAFYTNKYGYRMCLRAYLNGDGSGFNSHISIYIVLMRGDYDNYLSWPFNRHVILSIVHPTNKSLNITRDVYPDNNSECFQQPISQMNRASGVAKFVNIRELTTDYADNSLTIHLCLKQVH